MSNSKWLGVDNDLDGLIRRAAPKQIADQGVDQKVDRGVDPAADITAPNMALPEGPAAAALAPSSAPSSALSDAPASSAALSVAAWIKNWMGSEFQIDAASIEDDARFAAFGMDSVAAMLLTGALETWTGADLPPSIVWEHRSIAALANHVADLPGVNIPPATNLSQPAAAGKPRASEPLPTNPNNGGPLASDPLSLLARADELSEAEMEALTQDFAETVEEAT
ncbi:acyl carrier protein [Pseudophaeobacter leonis]|uniref:acyl carrier protein n=1 Tax=Pseudophaeobacter leonis TaxID=1144477 RepID=UPI0009F3EB74|nr:acyl carrier protein [Pseudophaeobacter leonis]